MRRSKIIIATILGFIAGIVCLLLSKSGGEPISANFAWSIILGRTLIGFTIGISTWKINYLLHGILIGLIVSLPMALASGALKGSFVFWGFFIMGGIYGFLIALITNLIVKEKKETQTT
ncbi:MAG: hypothetical protein OEV55_07605 [candidate division Zixibacteria bacterium]|nr:hypothetical protein [candidate division Zixibacteria bacterium]